MPAIDHRGGLKLKAGGTAVKLSRYRFKVGERITLSALLGGTRVTLLTLTGTPKVTRSGINTNVSGLTARLDRAAAKALNPTFGVTAFKRGLALGKVVVKTEPSETELLATARRTSRSTRRHCRAIVAQGITPGVIAPATLNATTASFPITGGLAALALSAAVVNHSGGVSLANGSTAVALSDYDVRLGSGAPQLFASLNGGAQKVAILDLDLAGLAPDDRGALDHAGRHRGQAHAGCGRCAELPSSGRRRSAPAWCSDGRRSALPGSERVGPAPPGGRPLRAGRRSR